jgi:hypothetical protein
MRRRSWIVAGFVVAGLALAGCDAGPTESAQHGEEDKPAQVLPIQGTDTSQVVLSSRAAERIGVKTEPVREVVASGTTTRTLAVPVTALVYDRTGATWVYTSTEPRTYVRHPVTVARVESNLALLLSGPAPGTAVTTVGAAELLGAEYGVEGG